MCMPWIQHNGRVGCACLGYNTMGESGVHALDTTQLESRMCMPWIQHNGRVGYACLGYNTMRESGVHALDKYLGTLRITLVLC